jgi:hypothetical protein
MPKPINSLSTSRLFAEYSLPEFGLRHGKRNDFKAFLKEGTFEVNGDRIPATIDGKPGRLALYMCNLASIADRKFVSGMKFQKAARVGVTIAIPQGRDVYFSQPEYKAVFKKLKEFWQNGANFARVMRNDPAVK